MRPDDNRPQTPIVIPSRQSTANSRDRSTQAQAAANLVRSQIDTIYSQDPNAIMSATDISSTESPSTSEVSQTAETPPQSSAIAAGPGAVNMQAMHQQQAAENPYERTLSTEPADIQSDSWKKYHSAWQSYYQQYYERYYNQHIEQAKKSLNEQTSVHRGEQPPQPETISSDQALLDLRSRLRDQINTTATKARKSRHFIPALAAAAVMIVFLFLQYNRVVFAFFDAYIRPGSMDPQQIIADPRLTNAVSDEPRLIVPTINVDAPILWDANAASQDSLNLAMEKGIVWFNIPGANAKPGQMGNLVLSGHSSNDWLDKGDYKNVFAPLERMKTGDTIYVNYEGTRYTYTITGHKVVKPTDVAALQIGTDKPYITLITCTPLGTALNRLLVFGEQVSPDPKAAVAATPTNPETSAATKMPSNSPTFIQRIFGIGN